MLKWVVLDGFKHIHAQKKDKSFSLRKLYDPNLDSAIILLFLIISPSNFFKSHIG